MGKIATGDEMWLQFVNNNKPKEFKVTLSNMKLMATMFWDYRGMLLVEFIEPSTN